MLVVTVTVLRQHEVPTAQSGPVLGAWVPRPQPEVRTPAQACPSTRQGGPSGDEVMLAGDSVGAGGVSPLPSAAWGTGGSGSWALPRVQACLLGERRPLPGPSLTEEPREVFLDRRWLSVGRSLEEREEARQWSATEQGSLSGRGQRPVGLLAREPVIPPASGRLWGVAGEAGGLLPRWA